MDSEEYGVTQAYHDGYQTALEDVADVLDDVEWRAELAELRLIRRLRNAIARLSPPSDDDEAYSLVP